MISRETLESIIPIEGLPNIEIPQRELQAIADDPLLQTIAIWCEAIREAFSDLFMPNVTTHGSDRNTLLSYLRRHPVVGIGIIDLPLDGYNFTFPNKNGFALGVALYGPTPAPFGGSSILHERTGVRFPVFRYGAEFHRHAHPRLGRSAALVTDGVADYLLTARHVVEHNRIGSKIDITCPGCRGGCTAEVAKKGHLYLDIALLRIINLGCIISNRPISARRVVAAAKGASIRHHFGSAQSSVRATVMQGIGPPTAFVNAASPHTFLSDAMGLPGDSGSAVSDDKPPEECHLVGLYNGLNDVEITPGTVVRRAFGHDADEAMRFFNCRLVEGLFQ